MTVRRTVIAYLGKVSDFHLDTLPSWDIKITTGVHFQQKLQQSLAVGSSGLARLGCGIESKGNRPQHAHTCPDGGKPAQHL